MDRSRSARMGKSLAGAIVAFVLASCDQTTAETASRSERKAEKIYAFLDVTAPTGITAPRQHSWGSVWGDPDLDGDSDLLYNRHGDPAVYLRNDGSGSFEVVGDEFSTGEAVDRHGCAWGEANGDGRPDLYCAQGAQRGEGRGPKELWIQTSGGFEESAGDYGVLFRLARTRSVHWLDFDSDGDLDLFLGNHHRAGHPNVMYRNTGTGLVWARVGLAHELSTVSSSWADWDRDGDPDLIVFQYFGKPAVAYQNNEGHFETVRLDHATGKHWLSGAWGDYNGDGYPDLHLVGTKRSVILRNRGGRFTVEHSMPLQLGAMSQWLDVDNDMDLDAFVVQDELGGVNRADFLLVRMRHRFRRLRLGAVRGPRQGSGDSVAVTDYDRDGRLDLFVTNAQHCPIGRTNCMPPQLLHNVGTAGHWAELVLDGDPRNPWGYGARVRVTTAGHPYERQVTDGAVYRSQSDVSFVHLGLGTHDGAHIRVEWPDGTTDCLQVSAGTITTVTKGAHRGPRQSAATSVC